MITAGVTGDTNAEVAKKLTALAQVFAGVELKKDAKATKKASAAEDEDFDTSIDESEGEAEEAAEITDNEITKAFATYAKEKSRDKALAVLKKLGYKTPKAIPQDERAAVIEKLGV